MRIGLYTVYSTDTFPLGAEIEICVSKCKRVFPETRYALPYQIQAQINTKGITTVAISFARNHGRISKSESSYSSMGIPNIFKPTASGFDEHKKLLLARALSQDTVCLQWDPIDLNHLDLARDLNLDQLRNGSQTSVGYLRLKNHQSFYDWFQMNR